MHDHLSKQLVKYLSCARQLGRKLGWLMQCVRQAQCVSCRLAGGVCNCA